MATSEASSWNRIREIATRKRVFQTSSCKTTCHFPREASCAVGIAWNDPEIGIEWPIQSPRLSAKDQQNPRLQDIPAQSLRHYA